jgi:hypothetical protein
MVKAIDTNDSITMSRCVPSWVGYWFVLANFLCRLRCLYCPTARFGTDPTVLFREKNEGRDLTTEAPQKNSAGHGLIVSPIIRISR